MPFRIVPPTDARCWTGLCMASVLGANLGDYVSHDLRMGHIAGVPWLALAFALVVAAERLRAAELWYWLAIVLLRTVATNLADLATHDGAIDTVLVVAVLAAAMAAVLAARQAIAPERPSGVPRTDAGYWLAMLLAGTLGTAAGDGLADVAGLPVANLIGVAAMAALLALRRWAAARVAATYWAAVVAIRMAGTNAGDMLHHAAGLAPTTLACAVVMATTLLAWRRDPAQPAPIAAPAAAHRNG